MEIFEPEQKEQFSIINIKNIKDPEKNTNLRAKHKKQNSESKNEKSEDKPIITKEPENKPEKKEEGNHSQKNNLSEVDTCYIKIQKHINTTDKLIVLYIEDNSDLVVEKGYLLYNPMTGVKTNFDTICGQEVINEKEDITADEESEEKILKFIYLKTSVQKKDDDDDKDECNGEELQQ